MLRPTVRRARGGVPEWERDSRDAATGSERQDTDAARPAKATAARAANGEAAVPEEIRRRFVQIGRKYYFPDGARAFTDRGSRLTTPSENAEVIRTLVTIAQTRGWDSVTVSGTERFRREAWFAAKQAGLAVRGYRPTEFEQQRLARTVARDVGQERTGEVREREIAEPAGTSAPPRDGIVWGRLVDHGRATYHHDPHEPMSYFVKLETARGERTVWGVDLERAVKESLTQPQVGDEVGLRAVRKDVVTVKTPRRDADGQVIGEEDLQTHRNRWALEKRAFFDARSAAADTVRNPAIAPRQAMQNHPELAGTYLYIRGAEEIARRRIRDPEDQKRFVDLIRGALADSVGRGEPLPTVRLRERPQQTSRRERPPRASDREPVAVRG